MAWNRRLRRSCSRCCVERRSRARCHVHSYPPPSKGASSSCRSHSPYRSRKSAGSLCRSCSRRATSAAGSSGGPSRSGSLATKPGRAMKAGRLMRCDAVTASERDAVTASAVVAPGSSAEAAILERVATPTRGKPRNGSGFPKKTPFRHGHRLELQLPTLVCCAFNRVYARVCCH